MTDKELLQQALDALLYKGDRWWAKIRPVTEAIKARLAQPDCVCGEPDSEGVHRKDKPCYVEPEPLPKKAISALTHEENKRHNKMILEKFYEENADLYKAQPESEPIAEVGIWDNGQLHITFLPASDYLQHGDKLYTAPPKKEWQGLTDEERYCNDGRSEQEIEYAKAIEAKLKEKNA